MDFAPVNDFSCRYHSISDITITVFAYYVAHMLYNRNITAQQKPQNKKDKIS